MNIQDQEVAPQTMAKRRSEEKEHLCLSQPAVDEEVATYTGTVETGEVVEVIVAPFDEGTPR